MCIFCCCCLTVIVGLFRCCCCRCFRLQRKNGHSDHSGSSEIRYPLVGEIERNHWRKKSEWRKGQEQFILWKCHHQTHKTSKRHEKTTTDFQKFPFSHVSCLYKTWAWPNSNGLAAPIAKSKFIKFHTFEIIEWGIQCDLSLFKSTYCQASNMLGNGVSMLLGPALVRYSSNSSTNETNLGQDGSNDISCIYICTMDV